MPSDIGGRINRLRAMYAKMRQEGKDAPRIGNATRQITPKGRTKRIKGREHRPFRLTGSQRKRLGFTRGGISSRPRSRPAKMGGFK